MSQPGKDHYILHIGEAAAPIQIDGILNEPDLGKSYISLIPYLSGGVSKDFETADDTDFTGNIGGDVKIAITTSLNLDLTHQSGFLAGGGGPTTHQLGPF